MATSFTTSTFATTFKDDFRDSDNFHRILFNSGRALQARELTQLQTILHAEMRRVNTRQFREGGKIIGGGLQTNLREFIKLATGQLPATPSTLLNKTFNGGGIKFKILKVVEATGSDPDTLYVEYTDTTAGTAGVSPVRVANGETLIDTEGLLSNMTVASTAATGQGLEVNINSGSFYVQGHVVFVKAQSTFADKYGVIPTKDIGFKLTQDIVTEADDTALFDNQGAVPNISAPGAHRFRITLTLTTRDQIAASENFVMLAKMVNGGIAKEVTVESSANVDLDLQARRRREESGDYVVNPFTAKFNTFDDSNLELEISSGLAYVDGYRADLKEVNLTIPKAQATLEEVGDTVIPSYGNFVLFDSNYNLPELHDKVFLRASTNFGGSKIGQARIRHYEEDGADHRAYLYDIIMDAGQNFANTRSIGANTSDYINLKLEDSRALTKNTDNNNLLFPLRRTRPQTIAYTAANDITLQKKYTVTTNASGVLASNQAISGGDTFTSSSSWVATRTDGKVDTLNFNITLGSPAGSEFNITGGADANQQYDIYALQIHKGTSNFSAKTKSLAAQTTLTLNMQTDLDSDGNGSEFLSLRKADIYKVESVNLNSTAGPDISNFFRVDNGQRDNFYGIGRLIRRAGITLPQGNAVVKFRHFTHSTSGTHFDVTSYPTGDSVGYAGIPSHRTNDGQTLSLRDVLDFRPVAGILSDSSGVMRFTFDSAGGGSAIRPLLPVSGEAFDVNATYFLPRKDRLVITTRNDERDRLPQGDFKYIQGVPAYEPVLPDVPQGSLPLFNFNLNAFTLNESDYTSSEIVNKRFTMSDIARLENRIKKLEEFTTLTALENTAEQLSVIDSAGLQRTKAGFLADNFRSFTFSADERPEYRADVDVRKGVLRPLVAANNVRLLYDSDNSTTTRGPFSAFTGDLLTLAVDSNFLFEDQPLATETENVNPYSVLTGRGVLDLSPSSDNWLETRQVPERIIDGGTDVRIRTVQLAWGSISESTDGWGGNDQTANELATQQIQDTVTIRRELVGTRVVDVRLIPFMRSRKIFFRAQGLRARTQYFPYLGRRAIDDYARGESTFTRFSERTDDAVNTFKGDLAHPEGSSNLVSDSSGQLIGSFVVPDRDGLRFRTGSQEFKLLNISGGQDSDATSVARAMYAAQGTVNMLQDTVRSTRIVDRTVFLPPVPPPPPPPPPPRPTPAVPAPPAPPRQRREENNDGGQDPLAQTFFVTRRENPNGIFVSKVRIYFATKDSNVPVQVQIRPVHVGIPESHIVPGAAKFLGPAQVNIPSNLNDLDNIRSNGTDFEFEEPIYLAPGREYSIVVLAESTEYTVHVARINDFLIGTTELRVNKQPTLGSLFLSQNGSTWTPDQDRDLMFQIYRAEFQSTGTALLGNATNIREKLLPLSFLSDSGSNEVTVFMNGHGLSKNDKVFVQGVTNSDITGAYSFANSLLGSRTVTKVDHFGFTFNADSNAQASVFTGGSNAIVSRNYMYDAYVPQVQALLPSDVTTIAAQAKKVSGGSYAGTRNTSPAYSKASEYSDITLNEVNVLTSPGVVLNDSNVGVHGISGASFDTRLYLTTSDTKVSPIIDLQRASVALYENVIDKQDQSATSGFNVPIRFVDETDNDLGTHAAKHVTNIVTLQDQAVGLKILFAANRPSAAGFRVYFKTGTADDTLEDLPYVEVFEEGSNPGDEDGVTLREYEYLAGGQVGNLNAFTQFQVKIVMTSTNSSKIPFIKDLRVIALVT